MTAIQHVRVAEPGARRPARWAAVLAGAALLLTACGTAPGAAAVVDGQSIPAQVVQDRTQAFVEENPTDPTQPLDPSTRALYNRMQATDVVRHQLALVAARDQGIVVTTEQVNAVVAGAGGAATLGSSLGVPSDAVVDTVYDILVLEQMVQKIPAAGVDVTDVQVTVDVVAAADRDAAVAARAKYLKDPQAMDKDAAAARAAGLPGGEESLLKQAQDASVGIFSAPEGQIVLIPRGGQGYFVVRVTKRAVVPAKLTQEMIPVPQSASDLFGFLAFGSLLLGKYATTVTVNPRYGQWDPQTVQVIADNSGL